MSISDEMTQAILRAECTIALLEDDVDRLERRIADAINAAQRSIRFVMEANSSIQCVFACDMDRVVEILTGNSPEIPDSSNSPANLESST